MTALDDILLPFGPPSGRHAMGDDTEPLASLPTVPLPFPPDAQLTLESERPVTVKVSETCGPCGSVLSLEWAGRADTLRVLRDWRQTHRCQRSHAAPDGAGTKGALMERAPDSPGFIPT